jgi:hypothetical protein
MNSGSETSSSLEINSDSIIFILFNLFQVTYVNQYFCWCLIYLATLWYFSHHYKSRSHFCWFPFCIISSESKMSPPGLCHWIIHINSLTRSRPSTLVSRLFSAPVLELLLHVSLKSMFLVFPEKYDYLFRVFVYCSLTSMFIEFFSFTILPNQFYHFYLTNFKTFVHAPTSNYSSALGSASGVQNHVFQESVLH